MNNSYSDSDSDNGYEVCQQRSNSLGLPFDVSAIEKIILGIADKFDFRVILSDNRAKGAMMVTTGLAIAGGLLGKHYGGKIGAAVGGAIGSACGLGIVAVAMKEIWKDIKASLSELYDLVYDFLAGMGIDDYKKAAMFLAMHSNYNVQLATLVLETATSILGKKILSSLAAA